MLKKVISIFSLSILSFIIVLLVTRIHDIAKFAILSPNIKSLVTFISCQIPYILPIVIPLACLISVFMTMRKLSAQHEITAFRALGLRLHSLISPLLLLGLILSVVNFMLTSELTPRARKVSQKLIFASTINNPLFLLQNSKKLGVENSIIDMTTANGGKTAKEVIFAGFNDKTGHIFLTKMDQLDLNESELVGENMVFITHVSSDEGQLFDHLFIENQKSIVFSSNFLCNLLENKQFHDEPKHWSLGDLFQYIKNGDKDSSTHQKVLFEIKRRLFYAIITFLLTWMGAILGISVGRRDSIKNLVLATCYTLMTFIFVILAKSFSSNPLLSTGLFILPLFILLIGTIYAEQKIIRGKL